MHAAPLMENKPKAFRSVPIMALVVVLGSEAMIRLRRQLSAAEEPRSSVVMGCLDFTRIGFLYGLFLEAFKLI